MATLNHRRQPDVQGGARDLPEDPAGTGIDKPVSGWTEYHRRLHLGRSRRGPDRRVDDRARSRPTPTSPASGAWPRSRSLERRRRHQRLQPRRFELVRARVLAAEKDAAIDFLEDHLGQGRRLLPEDPRRPGRRRHRWLAAREGEAYKASDDFFGGQPVWQNFSDWLAARFRPSTTASSPTRSTRRSRRSCPTIAKGGDRRRGHRGHQRPGQAGRSSK